MLPENIIYIGVAGIVASYYFYLRDMYYGDTKPNLVSWFIWMLAPFVGLFFQIKAGAGLSMIAVFTAGFGPLLVILFSIFKRNSIWKLTTFDIICGTFSILALILYILTHNLSISILFAIISDALAFIPTYMKVWKFPGTETSAVYFVSIFINILALLIIKDWSFVVYSFSVYLVVANLILVSFIYRKRIFKSI